MPHQRTRKTDGRTLNRDWNVGAAHALYRADGRWYHRLVRFPGALFDANGYVIFPTEKAYRSCRDLAIGDEVNVRRGIASIPGYVRVK